MGGATHTAHVVAGPRRYARADGSARVRGLAHPAQRPIVGESGRVRSGTSTIAAMPGPAPARSPTPRRRDGHGTPHLPGVGVGSRTTASPSTPSRSRVRTPWFSGLTASRSSARPLLARNHEAFVPFVGGDTSAIIPPPLGDGRRRVCERGVSKATKLHGADHAALPQRRCHRDGVAGRAGRGAPVSTRAPEAELALFRSDGRPHRLQARPPHRHQGGRLGGATTRLQGDRLEAF